ncbi:uncharacterized protein LOC118451881, partial [Egretta garzetta]|uniref:uncharacterized protein LOC118451881 n=1 Tax=Egretta garzetta TaxID=188379 RepID=UPI00163B82C3
MARVDRAKTCGFWLEEERMRPAEEGGCPAGAALALLGVLVYLGALCAACRRYALPAAPLLSLLVLGMGLGDPWWHVVAAAQLQASLDFPCTAFPSAGADSRQSSGVSILLHRELPQREDAPPPPAPASSQVSPPRAGHGEADYACVRKVKKTVPVEVQDGTAAGPPAAPRCRDGTDDAPRVKLEEMYSTVCKASKKKAQD